MALAFKLDHLQPVELLLSFFVPNISQLFHSHTGEPILITPRRERLKMGKWNSPNPSEKQGFQWLCILLQLSVLLSASSSS